MKKILSAAALTLLASTVTFAQQPAPLSPPTSTRQSGAMSPSSTATLMATVPGDCVTVTNYYKQNVYDPSDAKIGEISDVLVSKDGKIDAFIVAVGGFLGVGEKDVAVPFDAVRATEKNGKWYLTMNATKDCLQKRLTANRGEATWVPA